MARPWRVRSSRAPSAVRNRAGNLFALARAVGDATVNDLREAARQACGRAFAAEFLVPIEEIFSMRDDGHDVHSIAE